MPSTTSSSVVSDESSLREVIKQIVVSWAQQDADAMSALYSRLASSHGPCGRQSSPPGCREDG
jgi:hypothetical protein